MNVSELVKAIGCQLPENVEDFNCGGIYIDSRKVTENSVFICISGARVDGHDYYKSAIDKGAKLIVCERDLGIDNQIVVDNPLVAYTKMCARLFGEPAKQLKLIGVTGTSGKSTTTYMIKSVLEQAGKKVGLIGTTGNIIGNELLPSHNTTPEAFELHSLFELMLKSGCEYVVMEVSSQALDQQRVYGLHFETAVFTNFSQDHLDYHKTMEEYFAAKLTLFDMCSRAVVNADDKMSRQVIDKCKENGLPVYTYSVNGNAANVSASDVSFYPDSVSYTLGCDNDSASITVKIPGLFMVYNSTAAATVGISLGLEFADVAKYLPNVKGPKGVLEVVPCERDFTLIIDFAHTPEQLRSVTKMLSQFKKGRLVTLFGCGGDRDRTKRPKMAAAVTENSDFTIITSDNPRTEDPNAIIDDILTGVVCEKDAYTVIPDRRKAIHYAVHNAKRDDIVLFAGKGYETYQILNSGTVHFDEREVIAQALNEQ